MIDPLAEVMEHLAERGITAGDIARLLVPPFTCHHRWPLIKADVECLTSFHRPPNPLASHRPPVPASPTGAGQGPGGAA